MAIETCTKGLGKNAAHPGLHFLMGEILRVNDKTLDAIAEYEAAAKAGGREYIDAYRQIGLLYYHKLVDVSNAEKAFKKYVRAGGKDSEVDELLSKMNAQ